MLRSAPPPWLGMNSITGLIEPFKRWGARISLSLVDQALFSGANFVLNILLARWLVPDAYGAFAVAFAVLLFLAGLHSALIVEPMSVLGPSRFADRLQAYSAHLLRLHVALTTLLSVLVSVAAFLFLSSSRAMAFALWGVAGSLPFTLLFWLIRRACYLESSVALAVRGSTLYTVFLLAGLAVIHIKSWTTPLSALLVMGAAGLGASLFLYPTLKKTWQENTFGNASTMALWDIVKAHWDYGRWIVGASLAHSLSSVILIPLIATFLGLAQAGAFRAIQNLVAPLQQVITALSTLLLPWMSRQHKTDNIPSLMSTARKAMLLNIFLVGCYTAILVFFSEEMITALYADAYYTSLRGLLVYFVGALCLIALSQPIALVLRAVEQPSAILWSKVGTTLCLLLIGLPLIWKTGLTGAGWTMILIALAEATILSYCMKRMEIKLCTS